MPDIMARNRRLVNTDPQRRCYNGCHASSELIWMPWEVLEISVKNPTKRLEFWRGLNDYAVSQRGKAAKSEFKIVESWEKDDG